MKGIFLGILMLSSLLPFRSATATMTLPMTLQEIVTKAGQAFVGRCVAMDYALDEQGLPAAYIQFEVVHPIKGVENDLVTVKQFGVPEQERADKFLSDIGFGQSSLVRLKGIGGASMSYRSGEEVVLFLYPVSSLGFTSPVGFGQGLFRIHDESDGTQTVVNNFQNFFLGLSEVSQGPMPALSTGKGAALRRIELNTFLQQVSEMVQP